MSEATVLSSVDGRGVATVTLNRPRVNNAYNADMIGALLDGLPVLAADPRVRLVVIRGNGPHFQAGADLKWIDQVRVGSEDHNQEVSRRTAELVWRLNAFPRPVIALVHGGCFGGGIGVIAACDVVIAQADAQFAITEARWGLTAAIIIPQLIGAMGLRQVRRYALSGERFDAARAQAVGLVHEICAPGELDAAAAPVIEAFLKSAPRAIAETKAQALEHAGALIDEDDFDRLVEEHARKRMSEEAVEGLASFRDRRDPQWYPGAG